MFSLELEDTAFMSDAETALDHLDHDTDKAAENAANEGVREAQRQHPYTDRTYNLSGSAHVEPARGEDGGFGFDMVWPAPYAQFVDQGTSRAKPYPFTPIAEERAEQVLQYDLANAVDAFKDKLGG